MTAAGAALCQPAYYCAVCAADNDGDDAPAPPRSTLTTRQAARVLRVLLHQLRLSCRDADPDTLATILEDATRVVLECVASGVGE